VNGIAARDRYLVSLGQISCQRIMRMLRLLTSYVVGLGRIFRHPTQVEHHATIQQGTAATLERFACRLKEIPS